MLNIEEINNTIAELESSSTTFANCQKLASLYIVREHYKNSFTAVVDGYNEVENNVIYEYKDILPDYQHYCNVKRQYQLGEVTELAVISAMEEVCKEVKEFITTLYSSTDIPKERELISNMIEKLDY